MSAVSLVPLVAFSVFLPSLSAQADALDKAPSKFAKLDKVRVHYKSLGKGDTALVLIHGWSCDSTFWRDQVPALDGKIRVILIDLPGHGKSDKPKIDYTLDLFAKAVDAVLKDAGVEKAVLAGHSMGTPVVRQFYRLYPKKTLALIAVDGSFRPFLTKKEDIDNFVAQFKGDKFKENAPKFIERMLPEKTPDELRKTIKDTILKAEPHVAVSAMKEMHDPKWWKEDKIDVPVQAIMAKSPFWTDDYQKFVRKLAPKIDYRTMDGVGHFLMMEDPKTFNGILLEFLKKQKLVKE